MNFSYSSEQYKHVINKAGRDSRRQKGQAHRASNLHAARIASTLVEKSASPALKYFLPLTNQRIEGRYRDYAKPGLKMIVSSPAMSQIFIFKYFNVYIHFFNYAQNFQLVIFSIQVQYNEDSENRPAFDSTQPIIALEISRSSIPPARTKSAASLDTLELRAEWESYQPQQINKRGGGFALQPVVRVAIAEKGQFLFRQMNIVILIKTKNNPNKLTAGIIEIDLKSPDYQVSNVKSKPSRCNDETAFIQYSLKIQLLSTQSPFQHKTLLRMSRNSKLRTKSSPKMVTLPPQTNNPQTKNQQEKKVQLKRLLSDSELGLSRRKQLSAQKNINKQNSEADQSKTQKRSYGLSRSKASHMPPKEESIKLIKSLQNKYETAKKSAFQLEQTIVLLSSQNKQLKKRISQLQLSLSEQQAVVRNMSKRLELKEGVSVDDVKQLRNKLQQLDTELHSLMNDKNNLLNSMQSKEKQWLVLLKQKERTLNEEKRELSVQLQQKEQLLQQTFKQLNILQENNSLSEAMAELLTETNIKLEQQLQISKNQASRHKIELEKVNQDIIQLQRLFNNQMQISGQVKNHKKKIQDLQRSKDQAELIIKERQTQNTKIKNECEEICNQLKTKNLGLAALTKSLQQQNTLNQLLRQKQKELIARIDRYQVELKNQHLNSGKISKHVKQVEQQLNRIKMEVESTSTKKQKKIADYEKSKQLQNKKMQLLQQENLQLAAKYMQLNDKFKTKQDELFQLGQQIVKSKQNCINLEGELQTLREDNNFFSAQARLLEQREEEITHLREQIAYKDKLMEDFEHQQQLREIQFTNEIKLFSHKLDQREEQIKQLNEYIVTLQKKQLDLHQEVQNLTFDLKNKENQIQYLKHDFQRQRKNNFEFQQRMHILTATENATLTSAQQLRVQNSGLNNVIRENEEAINNLGKKYDNLLKGTVESLKRLLEVLKNSKNILNQTIKHQKVEVATLLNDCIRQIGEQRRQQKEQLSNLQKELAEESDKNRQNLKLIKIKSQIQDELERQVHKLQREQEMLQNKLSSKDNEILEYQEQIKEKISNVRELNLLVENIKKQGKTQLHKRDELFKQKDSQIKRLKEQIVTETERWKTEQLILINKAQIADDEFNTKLSTLQNKIASLEATLKTQKESVKLMRLKNADLQNTISKLNKQKQEIGGQIQKRTKQLIAARVQSEFKTKLINEKQTQISQNKKTIDKLGRQKQSLQNKRSWLQEGNKTLVINRNELEQSLRTKCNELMEAKQQIRSLEQSQSKISKQKQDVVKQRKQQLETISKLNETIKNTKEDLLKKQKQFHQLKLQKDNIQKQLNKKLNIVTKQKDAFQKQLKEIKSKQTQVQSQQTTKYNVLASELSIIKSKNQEYAEKIQHLKAQIESYQAKIANLTLQMTQNLNYRLDCNVLGQQKRKQILSLILELKRLRNSQMNKGIVKVVNNIEHERSKQLNKHWRELTLIVNQLKIKINRMHIQNEVKAVLLQDIKLVQIAYENICKCSVF